MQRSSAGILPWVDRSNLRIVNGNTAQDLCRKIDPAASRDGKKIVLLLIHNSTILCNLSQILITFIKGAGREEICNNHIAEGNPIKRWCCMFILALSFIWCSVLVGKKGWEASAIHLQYGCYNQTIDLFTKALHYCLPYCCWQNLYRLSLRDLCSVKCASADFHLYFKSVVAINSRWPLNPSFQLKYSTALVADVFTVTDAKIEPLLLRLYSTSVLARWIIIGSCSTTKLIGRRLFFFRDLTHHITCENWKLLLKHNGYAIWPRKHKPLLDSKFWLWYWAVDLILSYFAEGKFPELAEALSGSGKIKN